MKRLQNITAISLLLLIIGTMTTMAQSFPTDTLGRNKDMKRFYLGCMMIRNGEKTGQLSFYEDAMVQLNTFRGAGGNALSLARLEVTPVDTVGVLPIDGHVAFTRAYAKAKARQEPYKAEDLLRATGRCRVRMFALAPNSTVSYEDNVRGDCLLMAITGEPDAKIVLTAVEKESAVEHLSSTYEDGAVAFSHWQMAAAGTVKYVVSNPTDHIISVALVAN